MISLALKVLVLGSILALLGWAAALLGNGGPGSLGDESRELVRAFPSRGAAAEFLSRDREVRAAAERRLPPFLGPSVRSHLSSAAGIAMIHWGVTLELAPVGFLVLLSAGVLGLARRERVREGRSFASPTRSYLGKHLLVAGLAFITGFAGSPFPAPYWALWVSVFAGALGVFAYVANLPAKL